VYGDVTGIVNDPEVFPLVAGTKGRGMPFV
jgi:hypothetical protein